MASTTSRRDRPSDPDSARAIAAEAEAGEAYEDGAEGMYDEEIPAVALVAAGLIGAAIGAGLGLLAGRAVVDERASVAEAARRRAGQARREAGRQVVRAERAVRRGSAEAVDDVGEALTAAVRALGHTRAEFGDRIERELRALRTLARRGRRRGWLR